MRRHAAFYSAQEIRRIQHGHAVWMDGLHGFLHWLVIKCNLIVIWVKVTHMYIDFYHISWQIIQKTLKKQKVLILFLAPVDEMCFPAIKCSSKSNKNGFQSAARVMLVDHADPVGCSFVVILASNSRRSVWHTTQDYDSVHLSYAHSAFEKKESSKCSSERRADVFSF